jgi:hypothetical protein
MYRSGSWSDTSFPGIISGFFNLYRPPQFAFDQSGNVYLCQSDFSYPHKSDLYQGKDNAGTWTWTQMNDSAISIFEGPVSDGKSNIYIIILDDSSNDAILQYHSNGSAATSIANPVAASTLRHLVTDSNGNLYVVTQSGTNEANYQYDVWEYTATAASPAWIDTGLIVTSKNATIFDLSSKNGYLYASTQSGVYVYNGNGTTGTWARVDSQASTSLNFGSTLLYDLTQSAGIYKATLQ